MENLGKEAYSKAVLQHSMHPKNKGIIKNPDAHGKGGGPCGDETDFYIKVGKKKINGKEVEFIKDIKFETLGCAAAVAAASMTTEIVKGKPISEAVKLTREEVIKKLGSMPLIKVHCVDLTIEAIKNTIKSYKKSSI